MPVGYWILSGDMKLACHELGLHATLSAHEWDGKDLGAGVAIAGSLAACGELDKASDLVGRLTASRGAQRHAVALSGALAPYLPNLALRLVEEVSAPLPLRAALLLRTGTLEDALALLREAPAAAFQEHPDLALLAANAEGGEASAKLRHLNRYLTTFGLSELDLRDTVQALSPANMRSKSAFPSIMGPRVSVIMTAFNAADRIASAIESLMSQTWCNIELVVVDDASTDATSDAIGRAAQRDSRVRHLRLPGNVGTYVAKTVGFASATGDFITCHDSDDWAHPRRIELQMRPLMVDSKLVATTSKWVRVMDDGTFYARLVHPLTRLNPASPLFRRHLVEKRAGLWDAVRTGADSEFLERLRLVFGKRAIQSINRPLTLGSHRPGSLMTASDTGYAETGISPTRLAYWEAWNYWHIAELRAGRKPFMPPIGGERPFMAPDSIVVPPEDARRCLSTEIDYVSGNQATPIRRVL